MKAVIVEEQKKSVKEETKKPETFNHLTEHQKTLFDQYRKSLPSHEKKMGVGKGNAAEMNKNLVGNIAKSPEEPNAHIINKKKTFGNFGASVCVYKEKVVQEYISNV